MISYARLAPGPGFQPGRALLYYAQRLVTSPSARRATSAVIAGALKRLHGDGLDEWKADPEGPRILSELKRDGLAVLPPLLSADAAGRMADYFIDCPVIEPGGALVALGDVPAGAGVAAYPLETVADCPGLLALINAPQILRHGAGYLGCKPTLASVGVRWSLPTQSQGARFQEYHRDVDDWRFLKLFVYLSDVDEGSGPHSYVRTSHNTGFDLKAKAYDHSEVERRFGAENIVTVTGPPGTTFMADTLGVHRGGRPTTRPRLMLQVQYSLLPVFAFDYAPLERTSPVGDPYCNRLLFRSSRETASPWRGEAVAGAA